MVSKLESALAKIQADLEKATASGNEKKVKELEENLASRQPFLDMARKASRRLLRLTRSGGLPSESLPTQP